MIRCLFAAVYIRLARCVISTNLQQAMKCDILGLAWHRSFLSTTQLTVRDYKFPILLEKKTRE